MSLVVMGASWGGLRALQIVLRALPAGSPHAIAVAQHRSPQSEDLASILADSCALPVHEADDKMPVMPGNVYLAPPDYHLLIDERACSLAVDEPVCNSRPSIDVLFESAAEAYGPRVIAVVMTGANRDGAQGAVRVKEAGGTVIAQDPAEAEAPLMPQAAIATGVVDHIMVLSKIGDYLRRVR